MFTSTTESIMSDASANNSQSHNVYPTSKQSCGTAVQNVSMLAVTQNENPDTTGDILKFGAL